MMLVPGRIIHSLKLSLIFTAVFLASQILANPVVAGDQGMLWRIEKPGVAPSYLLGTAHVSDTRITTFKPELQQVLESVDSISLELDLDPANQMQMAGMMMLPDGRLEEQLGQEYFEKLMVEMNKLQMPLEVVQMFKPWAAALAVSLPANYDASQAMDVLIYQIAKTKGKRFYALETITEQVGVFENLQLAEQLTFLRLTIDSLPVRDALYGKVLAAYLASDLEQLMIINEESMIMAQPDFVEALMYALLDQRNQRMLQRMQPRLVEGKALIAVGALHLAGEQGLLALLRGQGFKVSAIY